MKTKRFKAGIHVLVKKGSKFLILKRNLKDEDDPGCWDLPGGGLKLGEQPFAAATRETREEAGIRVRVNKILDIRGVAFPNARDTWNIQILVGADYVSGKVKLSPEHTEFKWVTRKELLTIEPPDFQLKVIRLIFS